MPKVSMLGDDNESEMVISNELFLIPLNPLIMIKGFRSRWMDDVSTQIEPDNNK